MEDAAVIAAGAVNQFSMKTRYQKEDRIIPPVIKSNIILKVSLMSKFILWAARESAFRFLHSGASALGFMGSFYNHI